MMFVALLTLVIFVKERYRFEKWAERKRNSNQKKKKKKRERERERVINISNTASKTKAMNELISMTKAMGPATK